MARLMTFAELEALCEAIEDSMFTVNAHNPAEVISHCDHTLKKAIAWLEENNFDVEINVEGLQQCGGYCDCEVLFNVEENWEDFLSSRKG